MNSVLFVGKAIKPYSVNTQELFAPICQSIYQCSHMPIYQTMFLVCKMIIYVRWASLTY